MPVPTPTRSSSEAHPYGPVPIFHGKIERVPAHPTPLARTPSGAAWQGRASAAGGLVGVLAHVRAPAVGVVQPPLRQHHFRAWRTLPTPRRAELPLREGLVRVEVLEELVERGKGVDQRELVTQLATGAEPLEVPGDVLAELLAAPLLPHVLGEQLGVPAHHAADLAEARQRR